VGQGKHQRDSKKTQSINQVEASIEVGIEMKKANGRTEGREDSRSVALLCRGPKFGRRANRQLMPRQCQERGSSLDQITQDQVIQDQVRDEVRDEVWVEEGSRIPSSS
jgi:hypothetical protein